jgi:hypothetical protein
MKKMTSIKEYETLLDLFIQLVQSQAGRKITPGDEWLNDAQTLSIKLFRHLVSMRVILSGSTIKHNGMPVVYFVDHASIKVLGRAALETYLVFYYLFCCDDLALSKFRHSTWVLGGLIDRQSSYASAEEHLARLQSEKNQIKDIKAVIDPVAKHIN